MEIQAGLNEAQEEVPRKKAKKNSCWYWEHGCCHKGSSCQFSHVGPPGKQGVVDVAQIQSQEQCWYFLRGCCQKGLSCQYAHHDKYAQALQHLLQQPADADPSSLMVGTEEMKVPTKFARSLIGHGGENIRLLQQVTGCRANLEPAKDADEPGVRILKIQGIPVQRAHCKELVQNHYNSEQQAKILKYEKHTADDALFTAVKVSLSAHGADALEDELELAKIRAKITQIARKSGDGVDLTCSKESFEMLVRRVARNFFGPVCQAYYNKTWLPSVDFQLVLEAAIRDLVDCEVVAAHEGGLLERFICENHDIAKEEKIFLPQIWELARPLFDGQKTRKTATYAIETGRYSALTGHDEGSGTERAENFLRKWIRSTLDVFTLECGDPCAVASEEKLTEVYACLLNTCNDDGASVALPQRWACEALPPPEGWRSLVQNLIESAVVSCRVRLQEKADGKSNGKGTGGGKGPPAPSSALSGKGQDLRPPEPSRPPRLRPSAVPTAPSAPPAPPPFRPPLEGGQPNVFVRPRRSNYGTGS